MQNSDNAPWRYKPDDNSRVLDDTGPAETGADSGRPAQSAEVAWRAAEFIEHPHNAGWYGGLVLITAGLTVLVYFITKDYIATGTMPIVGLIVGVFAGHKPSVVDYQITASGLKIGPKTYPYNLFKSFSVLQEDGLNSVNLFPLKRFMPPIAAYFDPPDQDKIINALGDHLPYEDRKMDQIDRLSRRLRL